MKRGIAKQSWEEHLTTLANVKVRPITEDERSRWEKLMSEHYLGWERTVGEHIEYVAVAEEKWVGLLAFGAPAYALKDREQTIQWTQEQRRMRLNFITQNRRFYILPGVRVDNLASKILSLACKRISTDWEQKYEHPVLAVETFVDPQKFEGTCYRASGWDPLGKTAGFCRIKRDFYQHHGDPKQLWFKVLRKDAIELLCSNNWPQRWKKHEKKVVASSPVNTSQSRSLWEAFNQVPEYRKPRGMRYHMASVLACAACATLAGAENIAQMAEIVSHFNQHHLRAMHCFKNPRTGRFEAPKETTLRNVLGAIDADVFDSIVAKSIGAQQQDQPKAIALDGKALRATRDEEGKALHLVSAVTHQEGAFVGQVSVDSKSNEIPAARRLLEQMGPLDGVMVTADAAHTQNETVRRIVLDKGADYLLPVKGNQPSVLSIAEKLLPNPAKPEPKGFRDSVYRDTGEDGSVSSCWSEH